MGQREILDAIILQDRSGALVTPPAGCVAVQRVGTSLKQVNEAGIASDVGGSVSAIIDATARTWEDCCLRAARRVVGTVFQPLQECFEFFEGSLAASRTVQASSGTGSNTYSSTQTGRVSMAKTGVGAGTATVLTPAGALLPNGVQPILIAAVLSFDTLSAALAGYDAQIALCDQATWEITIGMTQSRGLSFFSLSASDPTGTIFVPTTLPAPVVGENITVMGLWTGAEWIGFAGRPELDTCVPDLVNVITDINYMGSPALGNARGRVQLGDTSAVAHSISLDKLQIWAGVQP